MEDEEEGEIREESQHHSDGGTLEITINPEEEKNEAREETSCSQKRR